MIRPMIRRVVTGLDAHGKSTAIIDGPLPETHPSAMTAWHTPTIPADNSGTADVIPPFTLDLIHNGGTVFMLCRIPPGAALSVTRTGDGGQTSSALRTGLPQEHCYDLIYRHGLAVDDEGKRLLMGSTTGNLWSSDNGGDDWQPVALNLPPIYALKFG